MHGLPGEPAGGDPEAGVEQYSGEDGRTAKAVHLARYVDCPASTRTGVKPARGLARTDDP